MAKKIFLLWAIAAASVLYFSAALAAGLPNSPEEMIPGMSGEKKSSFGALIMASKWREDWYLDLALSTELQLGPKNIVGIGLSLPLHFQVYDADPKNDRKWYMPFRKEEWDEVPDYLRILRYVRYGCKFCEDNYVYALAGDLQGVSLGHGTIVSQYYNNADLAHYKPGLELDLYWPKRGGIELLTNNFLGKPYLVGGRIYAKPIGFFLDENSYLNNFAMGCTVVSDAVAPKELTFLPYTTKDSTGKDVIQKDSSGNIIYSEAIDSTDANNPASDKNKALTVFGFDFEFKAVNNDWLSVTPFLDVNTIATHGSGMHLGVLTDFKFVVTINTRLEYRYFGDDYIPMYFDTFYEAQRFVFPSPKKLKTKTWTTTEAAPNDKITFVYPQTKAEAIDGMDAKNGYYAGLSFFFLKTLKLFRVGAVLEDYQGKNNTNFIMFLDVPALETIEFSAWYYKSNFEDWGDVFKFDERSLLVAQAKFHYSMAVIMAQFTRSWNFNPTSGKYDSVDNWQFGAGVEVLF